MIILSGMNYGQLYNSWASTYLVRHGHVQFLGPSEMIFFFLTFQFEPLLSTNNLTATFEMLCTPSASLSQYLTVPDGVAIDLSSLKTRLCNLDPELLQQEAMDFLDIDRLTAAVSLGVLFGGCFYWQIITRRDSGAGWEHAVESQVKCSRSCEWDGCIIELKFGVCVFCPWLGYIMEFKFDVCVFYPWLGYIMEFKFDVCFIHD